MKILETLENLKNKLILTRPAFGKQFPRAIDEVWYRRAVEQHYVDPLSYVYSTELNTEKFPLNVSLAMVTAAHAVFHGDGHRKAPAAVVGFQFKHDRLAEWFSNITSSVRYFIYKLDICFVCIYTSQIYIYLVGSWQCKGA